MNVYRCQPVAVPLDAVVSVPGSKSITNRALILAALADGTSVLRGILLAEDTRLMIDALRTLGVSITVDESSLTAEVTGCGGWVPASEGRIHCGNAGTVMRFCTALCALARGRFELDGSLRMRERPIGPLVELLRMQGCPIEYAEQEGYPPIIVHGRGLGGGQLSIPAPESSQFLSAVLMVAPYAAQDLLLEVRGATPSLP
ncbi:MAG: 3-phosphoshikimate 1-carboxyvinyltransferase, partial [Planctomycetota bacterium]